MVSFIAAQFIPSVGAPASSPAGSAASRRRMRRDASPPAVGTTALQFRRNRRFDRPQLAMFELPGVEHETRRRSAAVASVAGDRVADESEVDADLMRAAGENLGLDETPA